MDYTSDADPMISAAFMSDYIPSNYQQLQSNMNTMEFESFSRQNLSLDGNMDFSLTLDSPVSVDAYSESDLELGFRDETSDTSGTDDEVRPATPPATPKSKPNLNLVQKKEYSDELFLADRRLVDQRFAPYDVFPANNNWTLEEKADKLLKLNPNTSYTIDDLLNIDALPSPNEKVDMLIDIVARIHTSFPWNHVEPEELNRAYTSVAKCKKDKKKDANGKQAPKRPMNAFMIWSKKCRTLIAQFAPQLHNAVISYKLGHMWREFTDAEKGRYEREKERLQLFHAKEYPDYKYRPQKKPTKKTEPKSSTASQKTKAKSNKKKKQTSTVTSSVPGSAISQAVAGSNLSPKLKARLQVKIDSELRRGIGKRSTGIDIADLTAYPQHELVTSVEETPIKIEAGDHKTVHFVIDSGPSSVFDTPGNSPHTPITPTDDSNVTGTTTMNIFTFDDKSFQMSLEQNNNVLPAVSCFSPVQIKTEPADVYQCIYSTADMKTEPQENLLPAESNQELPVLTAETVESYFGSDRNEDLNDIMSLLTYAGDIPLGLPQLPLVETEGPASV